MDKNKIFDLFEKIPSTPQSNNLETQTSKINTSTFNIGMFTKLILNHQSFHAKLENFLKSEDASYNIDSIKESSEFIIYNRAWSYISKVDLKKKKDIKALLNFQPKILNIALNNSIYYFEFLEEYERCAYILKIQQFLNRK